MKRKALLPAFIVVCCLLLQACGARLVKVVPTETATATLTKIPTATKVPPTATPTKEAFLTDVYSMIQRGTKEELYAAFPQYMESMARFRTGQTDDLPVWEKLFENEFHRTYLAAFPKMKDRDLLTNILFMNVALGMSPPENDTKFYELLEPDSYMNTAFFDIEQNKLFTSDYSMLEGRHLESFAEAFMLGLVHEQGDFENYRGSYSEAVCASERDRCLAHQALLKGDAYLSAHEWFWENYNNSQLYMIDLDDYAFEPEGNYLSTTYADFFLGFAPEFVNQFFNEGGFEAVDRLYENPPVSSEQILHPERYPDDVPLEVAYPEIDPKDPDSWKLRSEGTLGEWFLLNMLANGYVPENQLNMEVAEKALEGWGGDAYRYYLSEDQARYYIEIQIEMDSVEDLFELYDAFRIWARGWFGSRGEDFGCNQNGCFFLSQEGATGMMFIVASDLDTLFGMH